MTVAEKYADAFRKKRLIEGYVSPRYNSELAETIQAAITESVSVASLELLDLAGFLEFRRMSIAYGTENYRALGYAARSIRRAVEKMEQKP